MPWKSMMLGAAGLATLFSTALITSHNAEARPSCYYVAWDHGGRPMADGHAWAMKKSWACNRAERRCKRELKRKQRQGKVGRGWPCRRVINY